MPPRVYVETQGCQMNDHDADRLRDLLVTRAGYRPAACAEEADLLVLNTCAVREKASEKVFSLLGVWRALKEARPGTLIAVGGCVASQEGEDLLVRAPFVDVVFGPQTLGRLPELLAERRRAGRAAVDVSFPNLEKFEAPPPPPAGPSAYVTVMEGCSRYCTFCIVPYTRGAGVGRTLAAVLDEVRRLVDRGVREVTFLGQNVDAWRDPAEDFDFADLLTAAAAIPGLGRIRFTTSHPADLTAGVIEAFATIPILAPHLHLPVQSGSDRVLALMKRGYTAAEYRARVDTLRRARPGIALGTDFIVGFPGETEEDFAATLALVRTVGFDHAFSFVYSPRPGTPAARATPVPEEEARRRLLVLQDALAESAERARTALVGREETVLVERPARRGRGEYAGRTGTHHWINFAAPEGSLGSFARVRVTAALTNTLRGRWLAPLPAAALSGT
jgi:tRNA-2-methylthio-N6-dimethylallyladenosine synthase